MLAPAFDFHCVLHLFLVPAFHVDFLGGFIPSLMPGRLTVEPLGFSSLFLRPVNFHKAFNVRTSSLIYRAGEPGSQKAPCNTAVFWHRTESAASVPVVRMLARAFSLQTPGVI